MAVHETTDICLSGSLLEWNSELRTLTLISTETAHIITQQRFSKNEWCILMTLHDWHPHYAPFEALLACITVLSPDLCRQRLFNARSAGSQALKRELKPVYNAISGARTRLSKLSPHLKIVLVSDEGYLLTSSVPREPNKDRRKPV